MKTIGKKHQQAEKGALNKKAASSLFKGKKQKPNVFHYHNYLKYLNDWMQFQKQNKTGFSIRKLAEKSGISTGYLPMVLAEQRPLSAEMLYKLLPHLELKKSEQQFFTAMHILGSTSSQEARIEAIRKMKRSSSFRENNPNEDEISKYLTKWFYPAIREMAADPAFKADPLWIQERLKFKVGLNDVKEALVFLIEKKYIEMSASGRITPPKKHIECDGGIYKIALTEYHNEFLELASQSISEVASNERHLIGHTFAIPADKFDEVREMMISVVQKIKEISEDHQAKRDQVYHIEMALVPLSKKKEN